MQSIVIMVVKVVKDMIEKIEIWLNIVHYCIYRADYKLHMLSNKINPFILIGKIPAVKRKFEEQGTTHLDVANKVWTDKRFGFGIMISGGAIVIFMTFLLWGLVSTLLGYLDIYFFVRPIYVFIYAILSYALCHFTVFKGDKYIKYFKKLEKRSRKEKWKYALLSLLFVIGSIALWLYSFQFLPKS